MRSTVNLRRGDIIRVRLDPIEGSEQAGERPALVVSPDVINDHLPVILVATITSRKTDQIAPFEMLIEPPEGGLPRRSKVMFMQMRSIDKRRVTGWYGTISSETLRLAEAALKVATGLTRF